MIASFVRFFVALFCSSNHLTLIKGGLSTKIHHSLYHLGPRLSTGRLVSAPGLGAPRRAATAHKLTLLIAVMGFDLAAVILLGTKHPFKLWLVLHRRHTFIIAPVGLI